ncbi:MAG: hypothetical protein LUQ65_13560 [Candidatus Helarchaeota archaeon]|nr:hypothetical protein [Candidatus Helarchaeota archaeon]
MNQRLGELLEKGWAIGNVLCLIVGLVLIIWISDFFVKIFGGFCIAMGLTYVLYFFTNNRIIETICILLGLATVILGIILVFFR